MTSRKRGKGGFLVTINEKETSFEISKQTEERKKGGSEELVSARERGKGDRTGKRGKEKVSTVRIPRKKKHASSRQKKQKNHRRFPPYGGRGKYEREHDS